MNKPPYAIIIGLTNIVGLQTARILAARGVPVIAFAKDSSHFCCRTKVCEEIHIYESNKQMIEDLAALGPKLTQKAVLFPCQDEYVMLVSKYRKKLEPWFHIRLPDEDVVDMLLYKSRFYTFAMDNNLAIPETMFLRSLAEAQEAARRLRFPCVIKPPSRNPVWEANTSFKAFKLRDAQDLLNTYDICKEWADLLIVQEWIEGKDCNLYSCNCYYDSKGQPLVTFVARKLRQWPPEVGNSCLGEECRNDVVLEETLRLFGSVRYEGLGYLEMKRDDRCGRHFIVEPNIGRPTGRSAIAEAGGVELHYTQYCDAVGLPLPENRQQHYGGARWMDLQRDLQSALHYWRKGELTLGEWWNSMQGATGHAVFSLSDSGPFIGDLQRAFRLALSRREREKRNVNKPLTSVTKEIA